MRSGFFSSQALIDLNRLTYWVGLPSLLVYRIAEASPDVSAVTGLLVVGTGATLGGIAAALLVAWLIGMPRASHGTFAQGVYRGNLTFIGLPIVLYAFAGSDSAQVEANALLAFGPMVVLYNVLAVLVLLLGSDTSESKGMLRTAVYGLLTNPILIACALGLLLALTGVALPEMGQRTLAAIGQMALPLALLCIGGTLYTSRIRGNISWAVAGALMKVALVPAMGFLLALWIGLSAEQTRIALILLACPTASASYILVKQMNGNEALASGIIVISNLLAVPALFVVLAVTG
ncbi:MAG: AEC family transporter [Ectothiorhodospiraceae bacterium]|nr:AEC family transporter [Ectothiorhodospiraceae bacterium]MCH8502798.1 AEC family transporter [Ectothiorhodospiraceae bacterium]